MSKPVGIKIINKHELSCINNDGAQQQLNALLVIAGTLQWNLLNLFTCLEGASLLRNQIQ